MLDDTNGPGMAVEVGPEGRGVPPIPKFRCQTGAPDDVTAVMGGSLRRCFGTDLNVQKVLPLKVNVAALFWMAICKAFVHPWQ